MIDPSVGKCWQLWGACVRPYKHHACGLEPGHSIGHVCYECRDVCSEPEKSFQPGASVAEHNRRSSFPQPTVGRIVHFYEAHRELDVGKPLAAIITSVGRVFEESRGKLVKHEDCCSLTVFRPEDSPCIIDDAEYAETPKPGCWSWPPREIIRAALDRGINDMEREAKRGRKP